MKHFPSCILLLLLILATHYLIIPSSSEKCHPDDKKALLEIKIQLGNPTNLSSWDPTTDCCNRTWYGVSCDTDTQTYRVDYLSLDFINLPQPVPIPPSITDLHFLTFLLIYHIPNLVGPIPPSISKLTKLVYLTISYTSINGNIPNTLSQIKTLLTIDLTDNKLTGPLPDTLSSLPDFRAISLDGNQLTGPIPESYGSFPNSFTVLTLSRNQLSGKIPASLVKLNLAYVDLSENMLEGDGSVFFGSKKRSTTIVLAKNSFAFDIGKVELPNDLKHLYLKRNKIYGTLPEGLAELKFLHYFNVSYNNLCGQIPQGGNLRRFDESCYAHNKCLCGSPLPACKT